MTQAWEVCGIITLVSIKQKRSVAKAVSAKNFTVIDIPAPSSSRSLNSAQKEAVEHGKGPLLIIAGAGTGKTRVITERISWLIDRKKAKSSEILALTFTQKAAQEMEERVDQTMPYGYEPMWISTFHSFADAILKQEAIYIGLDPAYVLMSQAQEYVFFRNHLFEFSLDRLRPHGNPTRFIREIIAHFSRLGDEDVSPDDYSAFIEKTKDLSKDESANYEELSRVYKEYADLKERESKLGFYDLVPYVLKLFRERPNVLKRYQQKFPYILVDEFQDTNYSQNELVCLLAEKKGNIAVVGDDDQSIYKFRGAAVSNILDFKKRYPACTKVVLTHNYRSNQEILDVAYTLVRNNDPDRLEVTEGVDKKLVSMRDVVKPKPRIPQNRDQINILDGSPGGGGHEAAVRRIHEHTEVNEAEKIAVEIASIAGDGKKYSYSDVAVLVRANDHANEIVRSLRYHKIPFRYLGSKGLYTRPEIKDLIAMLSSLIDPHDDASLYRLLMLKKNTVTAREFVDLQRLARKQHLPLSTLLEELTGKRVGEIKGSRIPEDTDEGDSSDVAPRKDLSDLRDNLLSKKAQSWVTLLLSVLDESSKQMSDGLPVGRILYDMAEKLGYLKQYTGEQSAENEWKAQNIGAYFKTIQRFERDNDNAGVREYMDYLKYSIEIGEDPQLEEEQMVEYDGVNISTIHGAKGLEFPVVFLVNLVNERFPTRRRSEVLPIPDALIKERLPEGDSHIQEERRLCYVGMTRAKDLLYLTSADYYAQAIRKKKQSIFLNDIGMVVAGAEIPRDGKVENKRTPEDLQRIAESEEISEIDIPEDMRKSFLARVEKNLSYSHLSSYESCPYQFYFKYFLEIPGKVSSSQSFGLSIHNTLREFYERVIRSKSGFEGFEKMPDLEDLFEIYRRKWKSDGYESRAQENQRFRAGKKYLSDYYENIFSEKDYPLELEYRFRSFLGDIRLKGVVDRIDRVEGGVRIIDYKTGRAPRDGKKMKNDLQVPVYIMGIEQAMAEKVKAAEYIYLEEGKRIEVPISPETRKRALAKVKDDLERLRKLRFSPNPGMLCKFCDYRTICDYAMME